MAKFMDQEIFDVLVFTSAWAKRMRAIPQSESDRILGQAVATYRERYPTDEFEIEVRAAERILVEWLDRAFPDPKDSEVWLSDFLLASREWHPNGKRKSKTLFNGTWFTSPRVKPTDRKQQFIRDLMLYFANISSGHIVTQRRG